MTTTRSASAAAKGKGRAASPRDLPERTAAARASAERVAAAERIAAVRAPAAQDPAPYQERAALQSAFTRIPNGTQHETVVLAARAVDGGKSIQYSLPCTSHSLIYLLQATPPSLEGGPP